MDLKKLAGVYAASITPLKKDFSPDYEAIPGYLSFLADRGCHGALILGTTGEGPSFSVNERERIYQAGILVRQDHPEFRLLAGTGTPSMEETASLTKYTFDIGYDGVVVLPPYYFRRADVEGVFQWYANIISRAVPKGSAFFGYHIPQTSGVPLPIDLLKRMREGFPDNFAGIKDSSGDPEFIKQLEVEFGDELIHLNGNDRLFSFALSVGASGCITALANIRSPDLRAVWDAHQKGKSDPDAQMRLDSGREIIDKYPPAAPLIKSVVNRIFNFPRWSVRPPLLPITTKVENEALTAFTEIDERLR